MNATRANDCPSCPICDGNETTLHFYSPETALSQSSIGSSRQQVSAGRILRCRNCGFGFSQIRSSAGELASLYRSMDTKVYKSELSGRERTARRHLTILERYAQRGRLLDVGCASGLFLFAAVQRGWKAAGVEPSEVLCTAARKRLAGQAEVHCATLEQARLAGEFDAVTLWDVLEHVPHPRAFLSECKALMRPGGHLFLNVPDLGSLQARVLGARWPLLLPEHLNYFTRSSLRLCGERAGLKLVCFGRRRVSFSLSYIAFRVSQHNMPGSAVLRRLAGGFLGRILVPVSMGETFAVWQRV